MISTRWCFRCPSVLIVLTGSARPLPVPVMRTSKARSAVYECNVPLTAFWLTWHISGGLTSSRMVRRFLRCQQTQFLLPFRFARLSRKLLKFTSILASTGMKEFSICTCHAVFRPDVMASVASFLSAACSASFSSHVMYRISGMALLSFRNTMTIAALRFKPDLAHRKSQHFRLRRRANEQMSRRTHCTHVCLVRALPDCRMRKRR
jgi:hypothetical protein